MSEYFSIIIGAIFVQNFVLARFLGCCPFLGVSKKTDTALGMGMAVTFVITMASGITWLAWNLLHLLFGKWQFFHLNLASFKRRSISRFASRPAISLRLS